MMEWSSSNKLPSLIQNCGEQLDRWADDCGDLWTLPEFQEAMAIRLMTLVTTFTSHKPGGARVRPLDDHQGAKVIQLINEAIIN